LILRCSECAAVASAGDLFCSTCAGLLGFELGPPLIDAAAVRAVLRERRRSDAHVDRSGVWRYRELLPPVAVDAIVTLRENDVPIYEARGGAAYARGNRMTYLHLGMNPTGSFKDAGMTVALSNAAARGARLAICASTGNTAASMAAYAARAGMQAVVLVPASGISASKVAQTLDYGAAVLGIDGDFDAALALVRRLDPRRVAIVNSVNPYRIAGQKTAAFVLLEQRGWTAPDWVLLPGGNLGNTSALGKGFREARAIGLTLHVPRLGVVQAAGAAPFARAWRDEAELMPVRAQTDATAIRIGAPASWDRAVKAIKGTNGYVPAVTDAAILEAKKFVNEAGIGCELASAASIEGHRQLVTRGLIGKTEGVVAWLMGDVLKDPGIVVERGRPPIEIDADIRALERAISATEASA